MNHSNPEVGHQTSDIMLRIEQNLLADAQQNTAAHYHLQSGGGRVRAKVCAHASQALSLDIQSTTHLASAIELLHNASLVHDDLQDNDGMRRGRPAVWKKFGSDIAICAGDFLIAKAFGQLALVGTRECVPDLITQVTEAVTVTIDGQCKDVQHQCHTLADYEKIAAEKSGPLLRLALELPLIASGQKNSVSLASQAVAKFAVAYQIVDDLSDWRADARDGHLNVVNVMAARSCQHEAVELARARAQYLLKRCQVELKALPCDCGYPVNRLAQDMFAQVSRGRYE